MKRHYVAIILAGLLLTIFSKAAALERTTPRGDSYTDSVTINFRQSKWNLDLNIGDNRNTLDSIDHRLSEMKNDSIYLLRHVSVVGGASPEGPLSFNEFLSRERAATLFDWFGKYNLFNDIDTSFTFLGRDWEGVLRLAEQDMDIPYRDETLSLLNNIVNEKRELGSEPPRSLERLKSLRGGAPYRYLYRNLFPRVRASKVILDYDRILSPISLGENVKTDIAACIKTQMPELRLDIPDMIAVPEVKGCKPFYMDIHTNMLYDALALPNIGAEFYVGKNFSVGANWLYGWWKCDHRHRYWRAYGGEVYGRWWFGRKAHQKPLTGHHVGVYGQMYTYDFEWGKEGEIGGKPGGNLWDQHMWSAGVEYGYSLPVARRLNIDFSLGVGYTTGLYHKYKPADQHYVWQSTHRRHYFGPTKAEIALVWLIGCNNTNPGKGGAR